MKKLIIGLYILFLLSVAFFSYVFVDPNLSYLNKVYSGFYSQNRGLTTFLYLFSLCGFFTFYFLFLWFIKKQMLDIQSILRLMVATAGILLFAYPAMFSFDIFNYLTTARVLFFYHENPYIIMPIEFINEPYLQFTHAANKIALYGPFWILLTGIPYLLGFGNFLLILLNFKLVIVSFYILTAMLIWKLTKNIFSVAIFSLNPLVIFETLVSGHNDIVMIGLVLFSYYFLIKKKIWLSLLFFLLSIFIKYASIILMPILLFGIWQTVRGKKIAWDTVYYYSALLMMLVFFLSPLREEIYSWYAIWFLTFVFLVPHKKILFYTSIAFSFSLLLRYTPYMLTGTYAGQTPLIKEIVSFSFPMLVCVYYALKKKN